MHNEVVLDLETQNTFQDIGSRDTAGLKISVVGVYTTADDQFRIYGEDELKALWPVLEHADRIIGYNLRFFDLPVLNNYYAGDCTQFPILDLMEVAQQALGYRPSLNDVAEGTLGVKKSGHGLDAVRYWQVGDLDSLRRYCTDDVRITRDLYLFGKKEGYLQCAQRFAAPKKFLVRLTDAPPQKAAVNLTLGI